MSFKTILINTKSTLSYENGWMTINKNKEFLDDVSTLIINTLQVIISACLLNEISKRRINLIFTDEYKNPNILLMRMNDNSLFAKRLNEQIVFEQGKKDIIWRLIIRNKILMQKELIHRALDLNLFEEELQSLTDGDKSNAEAFVARKYFYKLFGKKFNRREENSINSALNYGYSIIASEIRRVIVSYGYSTALGIHHRNNSNCFNLTYDFIEPFRPIIDSIVYSNKDRKLNSDYKKELIGCLNLKILYKNKIFTVKSCIEAFVLDVFRSFYNKKVLFGDIKFYDQ